MGTRLEVPPRCLFVLPILLPSCLFVPTITINPLIPLLSKENHDSKQALLKYDKEVKARQSKPHSL